MNEWETSQDPIEADQYACPSCAGPMAFDPKSQALKCTYCDFEKTLAPEGQLTHYDFFEAGDTLGHSWGEEIRSLHCKSCGATSHLDEKTISNTCAFCGSTHVVKDTSDKGIKPHAVVPFILTQKEAYDRFQKWMKKRFFAKKAVKDAQDSERLKGVYVPFWTFDIATSSYYSCQIGYNYTVTVTRTVMENGKSVTKHVQETRIRWTHKMGQMDHDFKDLLINASSQFNSSKINALEPFNLDLAQPYDKGYLSGFIAEKYSVSLENGFEQTKEPMRQAITEKIKRHHGGDHIRAVQLNTDYQKVAFQHVLLPIWLSSYLYGGKTYQFGINGQTGEVQGNYPISWLRVALVVGLVAALVALYFVYQNARGGYDPALVEWLMTV